MSTYDNNVLYRPLSLNGTNGNFASSICNWFKHIKVYKIVCLILILLFVIPMIAHYYILNVSRRIFSMMKSDQLNNEWMIFPAGGSRYK